MGVQVEGFGGDWVRGEQAGGELLKWGMVGRIGVGRGWDAGGEVFYVLKEAVSRRFLIPMRFRFPAEWAG